MIVVDTSDLLAIALDEPDASACIGALALADRLLISAGTLAEALIVAGRRSVGPDLQAVLTRFDLEVVDVTDLPARRMAEAYARWGRGVHRANLNLGDCFAYGLAKSQGCPLLYIGNDFAQTDIASALQTLDEHQAPSGR